MRVSCRNCRDSSTRGGGFSQPYVVFVQSAFLFVLQCLCWVVLPDFRAAVEALQPLWGPARPRPCCCRRLRSSHGPARPGPGRSSCSVCPVPRPSLSNPCARQERAPVHRLGYCSVLRTGIHEIEGDHLRILPSVDISSSLRALHTYLVVQTVIENLFHPHF